MFSNETSILDFFVNHSHLYDMKSEIVSIMGILRDIKSGLQSFVYVPCIKLPVHKNGRQFVRMNPVPPSGF